jgi:flavin-binding protein dodecin
VTRVALAIVAISMLGPTQTPAQSLADVARQEAERRANLVTAARTYTNGNLTPDFTAPVPPEAGGGAPSEAPGGSTTSRNASPEGAVPGPPAVEQSESWWRARAAAVRNRIQRAQQGLANVSQAPVPNERERARVEAVLKRYQAELDAALFEMGMLRANAESSKVPLAWLEPAPP